MSHHAQMVYNPGRLAPKMCQMVGVQTRFWHGVHRQWQKFQNSLQTNYTDKNEMSALLYQAVPLYTSNYHKPARSWPILLCCSNMY